MRIGIDGRALQRQPWSGVGQYTYHLLHALFLLDQENEYIVWYNAFGHLDVPSFAEYKNVQVRRTRWPNKILNAGMNLSIVRCPLSDVDIFFMPNLNFIALPAGVKLVVVAHDLSFEHFPEYFTLKSRLAHRAINPRALFNRADHVIAVSEHTKQDLMETYGMRAERVSVVYPGIAVHSSQFTVRSGLDVPYILYVGALEPRKNIAGIIEAYEQLRPRERLVIVGLSTSYVKTLRARIGKSKLRDKIVLKENPTEAEKVELYAGARVFVYPSYYEGFGFPPLEAMAAGVPVVASSASSVAEICGDTAVLVSPWSVQEIMDGMKILLEDEEIRNTYINAGYARVKEFSWHECARKVKDIFQVMV